MIYIVNGFPGSGKTTFEHYAMHLVNFPVCACSISTIDIVKTIAYDLGWDGTKTPANRKFLAELKDLLTNWQDIPFKNIVQRVNEFVSRWTENLFIMDNTILDYKYTSKNFAIFIDCREPAEIERLKSYFKAKTILIQRPQSSTDYNNEADKNVMQYNYDIVINNDHTKKTLFLLVYNFLDKEGIPHKDLNEAWEALNEEESN